MEETLKGMTTVLCIRASLLAKQVVDAPCFFDDLISTALRSNFSFHFIRFLLALRALPLDGAVC